MSDAWRSINKKEKQIMDVLLSRDFPGNEALRAQLQTALVSVIDDDGSLRFRATGKEAVVGRRVPVEAYYFDRGTDHRPAINLLVHVVDGMLHELEVYKDDGSAISTTLNTVDLVALRFPN